MENAYFSETHHVVKGIEPKADLYNGDPATDVINMKGYQQCTFILHQNGDTPSSNGNATVKVEACSSAAGSNATAIAFKYTKLTTGVSDVSTALTDATVSGFNTTAVETTTYLIQVLASELTDDKPYVRLTLTEVTDAPVIGSVMAVLSGGPKRAPNKQATALT